MPKKPAKKSSPTKQSMDVTTPDKALASATSKQIITSGHGVIQDPMVNQAPQAETSTPVSSVPRRQLVLKPLSAPDLPIAPPAKPVPVAQPNAVPEPKPGPTSVLASEPTSPEPVTAQAPEASTVPTNGASEPQDVVLKDVPSETEDPEAEQAEHDAEVQKLVASKQYFLPIQTAENLRFETVVILGILLSLLLACAWFDVALDAGLIHPHGFYPITHFFSQ